MGIMKLRKYKSINNYNIEELKMIFGGNFPVDTWEEYEQKPNFSNCSPLEMQWIPKKILDGGDDERIDTVIL